MQNGIYNSDPSHSTVAVVGLGKIGLPLAVQYAQHGRRVIGCDINARVVEKINSGLSPIQEEPGLANAVAHLVNQGLLTATLNTADAVRQARVVVVIVPLAIDTNKEVNFVAIDAATAAIAEGLQTGTLVIYETTLPVGTTSHRFCHILENASRLKAGHDFYLAYSPERVKSGHIFRDLRTYPKVVGAIDKKSTCAAVTFYQSVLDAEVFTVNSADEAEFVKLIETAYRDVNIALANEFACFADSYGLDISLAISAANTQPESQVHTPGVGVGGHCIPVYPYFLFSNVKEFEERVDDFEKPMLLLSRYARRINDSMAGYAAHRVEAILGSLAYQPVLILGVAYRGNVRETAFTSARLLKDALLERGAIVYVDDPLFTKEELESMGYTPLPAELTGEVRAIILQANHQEYQSLDFSNFGRCRVVLDGRKALDREKIESLNIRYISIGDGNREAPAVQRERVSLSKIRSESIRKIESVI